MHLAGAASSGLNFYTSGHAPEALLVDMDGALVHRWRRAFREIWPDYPVDDAHPGTQHWRRAHLYRDGDVLVIFEGLGLARLDARSQLVWANGLRAHHDLEVTDDGDILVLAREARVIPRVHPRDPVLEDFVVVLGPDGREKRRVSILEAAERSGFPGLWQGTVGRSGDLYHTNTLHLLQGRAAGDASSFAAGNVLLHMLSTGVTAVLDLEREKIVWARATPARQHDPKILRNGNLLIFLNDDEQPASRVLEYRSVTDRVVWSYAGTPDAPFYSPTCGAAQRLPNGNTLVTESDAGRAFEVMKDGTLVWEFFNPHRAGEEGSLIATLFEMVRLPADFPVGWADPEGR